MAGLTRRTPVAIYGRRTREGASNGFWQARSGMAPQHGSGSAGDGGRRPKTTRAASLWFARRGRGRCDACAGFGGRGVWVLVGSSSGSSSAAPGQADTAAAQAAIAPYTGNPSAFPVTEPLGKKLPAGTKFAFLQCSTTVCGLSAQLIAGAVRAIGGTLSVVNSGATASSSQAAASSLLALKPDVVLISGIDPSQFGGGLKQLSDAGIKVVSISVTQDTKPFGITFNYIGVPTLQLGGRLMADWVIAHKGPTADVVFYGVPELTYSKPMQDAFEQEFAKNCPSCKVRSAPIAVATLGSTAPKTVVTDLQ